MCLISRLRCLRRTQSPSRRWANLAALASQRQSGSPGLTWARKRKRSNVNWLHSLGLLTQFTLTWTLACGRRVWTSAQRERRRGRRSGSSSRPFTSATARAALSRQSTHTVSPVQTHTRRPWRTVRWMVARRRRTRNFVLHATNPSAKSAQHEEQGRVRLR